MDLRLAKNKKYKEMSNEEKQIFLLEQIHDKLEKFNDLDWNLTNIKSLLRFIAQREIEQEEIQNRNSAWTKEYIERQKHYLESL